VLDVVHKFVRDVYYKRFPELESLVHLPLEYVKTVKVICTFLLVNYLYSLIIGTSVIPDNCNFDCDD